MADDEMVGWYHQLNGHEFEQTPRDNEGQGSLVCYSPWGHKESDMTSLSLCFAKYFMFSYVPFDYFCFYFHYSRQWIKKDIAVTYAIMYSSKSFMISGLTFRSLIHFEFIFVCGVRKCSNFILLHVAVQFSQHHLLKRLPFPHCIFLPPLSKIRCPEVCGFISGLSILFHWSIFHTIIS